ncbi:unnamed protein product [Alopecurus aequalis]
MAFGSGGSRRLDDVPMVPGPIYNCSFCPRTFTNLHARGGHMTMHRREVLESRREYEEYMSKRAKDFTMHVLPANKDFWKRYHKGQERLILFPILKYRFLCDVNGEYIHDPMPSKRMVTKDKEKGRKLEILNFDLTLKPWFA